MSAKEKENRIKEKEKRKKIKKMSANICKKYYYMYTAFAARVTHLAVAQILHARRLDARGTPGVLRRGHRPALRRAPPLKP